MGYRCKVKQYQRVGGQKKIMISTGMELHRGGIGGASIFVNYGRVLDSNDGNGGAVCFIGRPILEMV